MLRLTMDWNDNERNMIGFLSAKMVQVDREMGAREIVAPSLACRYDVTTYRNTHLQSRTIMGANPRELSREQVAAALADVESIRAGCFDVSTESFGQPDSDDSRADASRTADAIVERYVKRPGLLA